MTKRFVISGILIALLLSMTLSVVSAGEIKMKQEGSYGVLATVVIWDQDTGKRLFSKTFNSGDTSYTYKVSNECKFHQLQINYEWKGAVRYASNSVSINSYNGGTVDITFGKKYFKSRAMSYSYVSGKYYYSSTNGTKLSLQEVTKDQATKGGKDNRGNWTRCFTWS